MIDEIRTILMERGVNFSEEDGCICVEPACGEGFEVRFMEDERFAYVSCSGWHDEFEDKEDAKNCFLNALTKRVRILATSKGKFEYKWEYQALENGAWESFGLTSLLVFPYWRRSLVTAKSNGWLK